MTYAYSLCSSSKGNSTYIGTDKSGILIDAGLSLRSFKQKLLLRNLDSSAIKAIFITHEHSDHIKGLKTIGGMLNVPIYGSRETIEYLVRNDLVPPKAEIFEINKKLVNIGEMTVSAFTTPHDSIHSLGYKLMLESGKTAVVCTDLGCVTDEVMKNITGSDFILLESNYDEHMLMFGGYPYFLKQRIASTVGHLSNENCSNTLVELFNSGTQKFMLGHLSEQNNKPQLALCAAVDKLLCAGAELDKDYILKVAPIQSIGDIMEI